MTTIELGIYSTTKDSWIHILMIKTPQIWSIQVFWWNTHLEKIQISKSTCAKAANWSSLSIGRIYILFKTSPNWLDKIQKDNCKLLESIIWYQNPMKSYFIMFSYFLISLCWFSESKIRQRPAKLHFLCVVSSTWLGSRPHDEPRLAATSPLCVAYLWSQLWCELLLF